jgi:hypothetical protein
MEEMTNKIICEKALKIGFEIAISNDNECILFNRETNAIIYLDFKAEYFQLPYVIVPRLNKGNEEIMYFCFDENIICKLKRESKADWPTLSITKLPIFVSDIEKKDFRNISFIKKLRIYKTITLCKIKDSIILREFFGSKNKNLIEEFKKSYQR